MCGWPSWALRAGAAPSPMARQKTTIRIEHLTTCCCLSSTPFPKMITQVSTSYFFFVVVVVVFFICWWIIVVAHHQSSPPFNFVFKLFFFHPFFLVSVCVGVLVGVNITTTKGFPLSRVPVSFCTKNTAEALSAAADHHHSTLTSGDDVKTPSAELNNGMYPPPRIIYQSENT